ncbi:MAG TPA: hypothetical protein IAB94_03775 [Candidatus Coproplasma avicola]|uniref:Uncharacterized protein n=1 Tax=Candidatus Coproplasma avicola TaxID=2840744 RepID=A0A9D1E619_9FIRM|nr:hypothetical protein [Candidatus Coproplasma avicola]
MQIEEKRKRIIAAVTVAGVTLIVILFAIVIYQIIDISILKARRDRLKDEYEYTISQIDEGNDWLENFELHEDSILYMLAIQNGYVPR